MTLLSFAANGDHANIITDTMTYTGTTRHLSTTSKVTLLPHLDAAVLGQGSTQFARLWCLELLDAQVSDFDELNDIAADRLRALWERLSERAEHDNTAEGGRGTVAPSIAFHIGWSQRAGRFVAYQYASDFGFRRDEITGLHVMPSPLDVRPSPVELGRLRRHFQRNFDDASPVLALAVNPAPVAPSTAEEWKALAVKVREHRALVDLYSGFKTYVGGDVIHTELRRGHATQTRVHTFDDQGEEFEQMMAGSLHPIGQNGPCGCGSGERLVDCCLSHLADQACPCGSPGLFRDCCRVAVPAHVSGDPATA